MYGLKHRTGKETFPSVHFLTFSYLLNWQFYISPPEPTSCAVVHFPPQTIPYLSIFMDPSLLIKIEEILKSLFIFRTLKFNLFCLLRDVPTHRFPWACFIFSLIGSLFSSHGTLLSRIV